MTLLLFDIDGTMLLTGGAGMRALNRAGKVLLGDAFSFDGVQPAGGLDPLLFREAAVRSGVDDPSPYQERFKRLYLEVLREELEAGARGVRALPGVLALLGGLGRLALHQDLTLGLLTGNYREGALLKLAAAGIDSSLFTVSVCGDDAADRRAMVAVAKQQYSALAGRHRPPDSSKVIVIGDTPRDVDCAHSNGALCFAVATGPYSTRDLEAAGADVVVPDLTDPSPLLALMDEERKIPLPPGTVRS